jgi:hypothetical protein
MAQEPLRRYENSLVIMFDKEISISMDNYAFDGTKIMVHFMTPENMRRFLDAVNDMRIETFGLEEKVELEIALEFAAYKEQKMKEEANDTN